MERCLQAATAGARWGGRGTSKAGRRLPTGVSCTVSCRTHLKAMLLLEGSDDGEQAGVHAALICPRVRHWDRQARRLRSPDQSRCYAGRAGRMPAPRLLSVVLQQQRRARTGDLCCGHNTRWCVIGRRRRSVGTSPARTCDVTLSHLVTHCHTCGVTHTWSHVCCTCRRCCSCTHTHRFKQTVLCRARILHSSCRIPACALHHGRPGAEVSCTSQRQRLPHCGSTSTAPCSERASSTRVQQHDHTLPHGTDAMAAAHCKVDAGITS
jgi:hypothetical protein